MDVDSIDPGVNFLAAIEHALTDCRVLLAVIGPRWLDAVDKHGRRRIDDPRDFVRLEIATALRRGIPVIPVLIDEAELPRLEDLPEDLRDLVFRQVAEISHTRFRSDSRRLIDGVARMVGRPDAVPGAAPSTSSGATPAAPATPPATGWSATLLKTGLTRVFDIQLSHEKHSLVVKNGVFAFTVSLDGRVVWKRVTNDPEFAITFPISDGSTVRTVDLWAKITDVLAVFKRTRIVVDGRTIFDD